MNRSWPWIALIVMAVLLFLIVLSLPSGLPVVIGYFVAVALLVNALVLVIRYISRRGSGRRDVSG